MYLSTLSNEEKALFLGLAYDLATIDGDYSEAEQITINGYCQEMQIVFDKSKMVKAIDNIVETLCKQASDRVKRIVVFEAIGLAMADNNYDDKEREVIYQMAYAFGLGNDFCKKCEELLNEYIIFQNKINTLILR